MEKKINLKLTKSELNFIRLALLSSIRSDELQIQSLRELISCGEGYFTEEVLDDYRLSVIRVNAEVQEKNRIHMYLVKASVR